MNTGILQAILASVGLISAASLGAILLFISPTTGFLVPILFSISLFLVLVSGITSLGMLARKKFINQENKSRILAVSFREGILMSFLAIIYIWLAWAQLLKVWSILLGLALILTLEYYFLTHNMKYRRHVKS